MTCQFSYSDHDFSNNLTGTDFAWGEERPDASRWVSIDLSGNLRVRNKSGNCYDGVRPCQEAFKAQDSSA